MPEDKSKTMWKSPETIPKDRMVLVKTERGVVSAQYFAGEWSYDYERGEEYTPAVFSCYDDAITLDADWDGEKEYFPDIEGWMELPE